MSSPADPQFTVEEKLIFGSLAGTWVLYAVGALYIAGPVLGVALASIYAFRAYGAPALPASEHPSPMPVTIMVWIVAMVVMLIALLVGHAVQDLGVAKTIKSTIGWAKGWALLAIFPLAGACLLVRKEILVRANRWFILQTLILIPVFLAAPTIGLPEKIFVSPLKVVGGPGPEYFTFFLYTLDPESGAVRLQFTAPWAPAAGFVANIMLIVAMEDKRLFWRGLGVFTAVAVVLLCKSRMALLCLLLAWPAAFFIGKLARGWPALLASAGVLGIGLFSNQIVSLATGFIDRMNSMRAGSNRVRQALNDMAFDRWWTEARIWGHGIVERGPHHVENMPIGSHHTWLGLLFVKGAVGFLAMLIAMLWTTIDLALTAQVRREARAGLAVIIVMWFFSFSENLESLAYIYWPGLVMIGMGLRAAAEEARAARLTSG